MERLPWEYLDKYFKKQINDSDQHFLDVWIAESEEHELLFKEIDANIKEGFPFPGNFNEDAVQLWRKLKEKFDI